MMRKFFVLIAVLIGVGFVVFYLWTTGQKPSVSNEENTATSSSYSAVSPIDALAAAAAAKIAEQIDQGSPMSENSGGANETGNAPPEGYIEYRNTTYGFSYFRPSHAKVTEYDEGGGATTLTYEDFQNARGFQVYIVPYSQPLITEAQFRKDVPSGVRNNVNETTLDGIRAVTFNSIDEYLGETREIWVIHNGYLYEITTFAGTGEWFTPIIQSWRFF